MLKAGGIQMTADIQKTLSDPKVMWLLVTLLGQAHIETQADARQGRAGQEDAARETLRDTVWAHIEK